MAKTLTICYVADASNIHVKRWLTYFSAHGHKVVCLSDKEGKIPGVEIIRLPNRDSLLAEGKKAGKMKVLKARAKMIKQAKKKYNPDILHAIFLYQRGWSAAWSGLRPMVITLLGSDIFLPKQHYRSQFHLFRDHCLNRVSLRKANLVTAVTDNLAQTAIKQSGKKLNVELVPIGTDTKVFNADKDASGLRDKLKIDSHSFVVLSPRQVTPLYNHDILIEAIPATLKEIPNAVFIIKDTFCDTEERKSYVDSLKQRAEDLEINHAIRWESEVPFEELPLYYNASNVVISIPTTDGMPVTLFDAMACEKPVIVGDLPSYNEVIIHNRTGLRVPIRDVNALSQAIIRLAKEPQLAERLVEESQVILQQYGIFEQQMHRMSRFYQTLADKGSAKSHKPLFNLIDRLLFRLLVQFT